MLQVKDLNVFYGGIHAIKGVSLKVKQGEIVALIGANGAGKSSTLKAISNILKPRSGDIIFEGSSLLTTSPHKIVSLGVSHVPEGRRIFANLTVLENLELGAFTRTNPKEIRQSMERVFLSFPRLKERLTQVGGTLSGGEQQMLAIGRALMSNPRLLLLDEPSMGLAPLLVREIFSIVREINAAGTTILLVEQNAHMALSIAHSAYVLETGSITLAGTAQEIANNPAVQKAYLGGH
ncbi:MAG: ABC transporter ATP-binding protein [Peptococcaceae bacterium]|nr:ABC transporter ATP-binding protein [Peptococcaceae bacterium]